ncbi:MAG: hypothetical protein ACLPN6_05210 [Streptosporangiaceae bacterium]|jgi:spore coat protein U-like protein
MRLTRSAASVGVLAAAMLAAGPAAFAGTTGSASPATVSPGGQVTFTVDCGGPAASATLFGTTLGLPEQIPMTPAATAGDFSVTVTIPARTAAGPYNPGVDCSNNSSTTISLDVQDLPAAGGAQTGDGTTSTTTNGGLALGGLALIAGGAITGGFAVSRRRAGS